MVNKTIVTPIFYGGREHFTKETLRITNPANPDELVGEASAASETQALEAVNAAKEAFPIWAKLSPKCRASQLLHAAQTIMEDSEVDAALLSGENGKVKAESTFDLIGLKERTELAADLADEVEALEVMEGPPTRLRKRYVPVGVVTIIVPFNWPLAILGASLPYALMAGNTVVVKPPPSCPLATTKVLQRYAQALPDGVVNIVTGTDEEIGSPLVSNSDVAKVCFTGSVRGGKRIMKMAAEALAGVTLELGGNDGVLILDDADLSDDNMDMLFMGIFSTTGQVCMNAKRIFVHESKKSELVEQLTRRLKRTKLGPASDGMTTMGPLHQKAQLEYLERILQEAKDSGAEVIEFGELPGGVNSKGYFVRPAIVLEPPLDIELVREEQFGPAIPIISFSDEQDGIRMVNDVAYGLCNSVWTKDPDRAIRVGEQLEAGYIFHNAHGAAQLDQRAPFGGIKQSGIGREMGIEGLREFQEPHALGLQE